MATRHNYLPFVARESLYIPSGESRSLKVISAVVASRVKTSKIIYKDFFTRNFSERTFDSLLCRYGYERRGYLIEEPIPVQRLTTAPYSNTAFTPRNGFDFPKPFILEPGQAFVASLTPEAEAIFGVTFRCKRMDNGEPYLLYWSQLEATAETRAAQGSTMTCPGGFPLYVENFQVVGRATTGAVASIACQLYDPSGMEIVKVKVDPNAAAAITAANMLEDWANSETVGVELGEHAGWALPAEEPIIIEYENQDTADIAILVTVRGSAEVLS